MLVPLARITALDYPWYTGQATKPKDGGHVSCLANVSLPFLDQFYTIMPRKRRRNKAARSGKLRKAICEKDVIGGGKLSKKIELV